MSDPYVGEVRMFAGNFAPDQWALCDGQLLSIAEYDTLFVLIGTTYGGDGQTTFAVPDLRGRIPVHAGQGAGLTNRVLGQQGGAESVTLTAAQMPGHTHAMLASRDVANAAYSGANGVPAAAAGTAVYGPVTVAGPMTANTIGPAGGSQAHDNVGPFLCVNFIIALYGIFPSQN
jgi:microcystin-dependent protein